MAVVSDPNVEGFVGGVRLAWAVHLMLIHDESMARETTSSVSSNGLGNVNLCLETVFSNNVFQFLLDKVLRTAAYQVSAQFCFHHPVSFYCSWENPSGNYLSWSSAALNLPRVYWSSLVLQLFHFNQGM